ncbi:MAG TPA: autotransporter-associated beta strand repeat-containing protein, partial [Aliidongia sp.]|uniref:autotransporter outer membrane beta-barrel domain-containing protein n=1 Tax=Aliidongia sp. TaxID=1914230 RepID=UPI002DDC94ED
LDLNTGTLTLSGANSFAGPVNVNAGLLVLRGGLAMGDTAPVIVAGPGTLEVDNAERVGSVAGSGGIVLKDALFTGADNSDTTFSGVISGTGELVKEGSGTFTLTGPNTYSDGTEIDSGTLKGDSTSLTGYISNNALLYFAQNIDGTFAGSITGGGAIEKEGEGTLALTGDNSGSSGAITIGAGRVVITSAANIGTGVITLDNGALEIDERTDLANDFHLGTGHQMLVIKKVSALPGTMSGEGGFTKAGPGKLSLTGINTYAGDTDIQEGLVNVDGVQTASRSVVERDATLGGSGTSHGILAKAGSTLAPGHSIGTMYSDDAGIRMDAGSTYHVEISPFGRSDKLVTTGKATIDHARLLITREFVQSEMAQADLAAIAKPGKLVILSAADGVSGTFDTIYPSFAFLNLGVSYQKTFVDLNVGRNPISFESAGTTPNERSVGAAIEGLKGVHPIYNVLLTVPTLADAAMLEHQVSGEIHADVAGEVLADSAIIRDAVFDRMATRAPGTPAFWLHGLYGTGTTSADGNAVKLDRRTYGVVGGVDQALGGNWLIGIGGGYEQTPLKTATMGTAQVDSYHAAAYGGGDLFGLSLYLGGAYGRYDTSTARVVDVAGLVAAENAQYGVNQGQAFGRIGIPIAMDDT